MKLVIALSTALLLAALSLTGCADGQTGVSPDTVAAEGDIVDLTQLSATVVYAEVYNMTSDPASYTGKTVKIKGQLDVYEDESTGKLYFSVIVSDATACCQLGLEFVLEGEHTYPDDYPETGSEITVTGVFDTYYEGEYQYLQLTDAAMTVG